MRVQLGLVLLVQLLLLSLGVVCLSDLTGALPPWPTAAGSPLGWIALLVALAALGFRFAEQKRPLRGGCFLTAGLAFVTRLGGTEEGFTPVPGFYSLLLGWPLIGWLWCLLPLALVGG